MKSGARIGLAVGFGYLLGRRRKLRTALTLAAAVAAGRASREPGGLLKAGGNLLQSSTHLSDIGRLGAPLAAASKAAATAAAGSGIDAISGKLRGSADALRRKGGAGTPDGGSGDGDRPGRDAEGGQGDGGDAAGRSDAEGGQGDGGDVAGRSDAEGGQGDGGDVAGRSPADTGRRGR
ncbi:hypothetical protein KBX06_04010 [Micromonospora sp. C31]|uniref:hypothetical protein n=1 Tax=Micromonospora sp. C31 TaxID=2824876 RepID=UPI001B36ADDF|nr:hypothetical protein [Micromonospora sp. C31]MBQ1072334.1 hypothetical protein [Micromonospora sp. C31]